MLHGPSPGPWDCHLRWCFTFSEGARSGRKKLLN
jgi:hypothetical protein